MSARGYCTHADVAGFLGLTFTAAQEAYADSRVESAEEIIDRETKRGWLLGAQTLETHQLNEYWRGEPYQYGGLTFGGKLYVKYAPLASVEAVYGRMGLGTSNTLLTAGYDYEVVDLEQGLLRLVFPSLYDRVQVSYTPVGTVPAAIRDAAAELIAWWMQPGLRPDTYGLYSVSLPDLSMRFAFHDVDAIPPSVQDKLDRFTYPTHG